MGNKTKIKRAALGLFIAISFVLLWFIIDNVGGLLQVTTGWNATSVTLTAIGALIILATLVIALITLYSIKTDETPFNIKNVKRLRAMALFLNKTNGFQKPLSDCFSGWYINLGPLNNRRRCPRCRTGCILCFIGVPIFHHFAAAI